MNNLNEIQKKTEEQLKEYRSFTLSQMEQDGSLNEVDAKTLLTIVFLNYRNDEKIQDGETRREVMLKILPDTFRVLFNEAEFLNGLDQGFMTKSVENNPDLDYIVSEIRKFLKREDGQP